MGAILAAIIHTHFKKKKTRYLALDGVHRGEMGLRSALNKPWLSFLNENARLHLRHSAGKIISSGNLEDS